MGNEYTLPRKLSLDSIMDLLEQVKRHPGQEETKLAKLVTEFSRGKSALLEWKLVRTANGGLSLSEPGQELAYAPEEDKPSIMLHRVLVAYEPYYVLCTRLVKDAKDVVTTEDASRIFVTKARITLGHEHMNAACAMAFAVMEAAGLGTYKRGRRGQLTRIEFHEDALEKLQRAMDQHDIDVDGGESQSDNAKPPASGAPQEATRETPALPTAEPSKPPTQPVAQLRHAPPAAPAENSHRTESTGQVHPESVQADWLHLPNPLFDLRIKKDSAAWDALEKLIPIYRELFVDVKE